jgi:glycosyltransferase involved in cell wall biosynthesis
VTSRPLARRVLYISYDGVLEPLGESQVVAYLERLTPRVTITLLSFEKPVDLADETRVGAMRRRLQSAGISWVARRYRKRPPVISTALDILAGCQVARRWAKDGDRGIVHARGYVPALMALAVKRVSDARFLFDMRGFWVDEKVEAGHWKADGLLYRVGKYCERRFFGEADAIVSLTRAGVHEFPKLGTVKPGIPVVVIPTCADLDRFQPGAGDLRLRRDLGLEGAKVFGCVGTLSNWYLREETLSYLAWAARQFEDMKALIVTRDDHRALRADAERLGLPADRLVVTRASFDDMPALIQLMDLGVFFIRACFSKRASAATKLAEFLGCGVPVVINDGIGDSGETVRSGGVGAVLPDTSLEAFESSLTLVTHLLADRQTAARCRDLASREFSLERGVRQYAGLYDQLS